MLPASWTCPPAHRVLSSSAQRQVRSKLEPSHQSRCFFSQSVAAFNVQKEGCSCSRMKSWNRTSWGPALSTGRWASYGVISISRSGRLCPDCLSPLSPMPLPLLALPRCHVSINATEMGHLEFGEMVAPSPPASGGAYRTEAGELRPANTSPIREIRLCPAKCSIEHPSCKFLDVLSVARKCLFFVK